MWYIILGAFTLFIVVFMILLLREIKNAPLVPDTMPFLRGDYVPTGEEYFKYFNTFCKNCKFFDGTATCLNEHNFGVVDDHNTKVCKKDSIFEPK
jgi:hypothetical protein